MSDDAATDVMEALHSCRCCLRRAPDKDLKTPYTHLGNTEIYLDMIEECFNIQLNEGGEECGICSACVGRLRDASAFRLQVQRSQAELQARLERALQAIDEELAVKLEVDNNSSSADTLYEELPVKSEVEEDNGASEDWCCALNEETAVKSKTTEGTTTGDSCEEPQVKAEVGGDNGTSQDLALQASCGSPHQSRGVGLRDHTYAATECPPAADETSEQEHSNLEEPVKKTHKRMEQTIEIERNGYSELSNESYKCTENNQILGDKDDSMSSDVNESHKCIAEEMERMIGDAIFGSDDSIAESIDPLPKYTRPPRQVSETESDPFGSDDPTYQPAVPHDDSTNESDKEDHLTMLVDSRNETSLEQQPGPSRQPAECSLEPQPGPSCQPDMDFVNATDFVSIILTDVLDLVWTRVKPLSRCCRANPDTWKKNVAKKRRREGLPYETNKRCRAAKVPKLIDCTMCKFKCTETFTLQDRETLCRAYWAQDFVSKKNFILSRVTVQPPKRVTVNRKRPRPYNTKCYFDVGTEHKQVCQAFFCSTLNISGSVIKDAVKHRNSLGLYSVSADPRGSKEPANKTSAVRVQDVVDHINSFPIMEGHYVRKTSKRRYLDCGLSLPKMYELYLEKYKEKNPVSEMTYRRIFSKEFNLSFFVPKKDQCQTCNKYHAADEQKKIKLETSYQAHIERKFECTREKEKDKIRAEIDENFISVSFDLQAVLQIPCSKIGLLYYLRKLTLYNLCIYESALPNNAYCFPWSEVHGKKGSAEIGSILIHYLSSCVPSNVTEISLFSDTCSGQNRNQYVTAILLWAVNTIDGLEVIEQKFLESGHSYMEADSMHSSIENAKRHNDVFSITDWINIFKRARTKAYYYLPAGNEKVMKSPYQIKEFKYNEFYDLKGLAEVMLKNKTKDSEGNTVKWLKIKRIRYVKNDQNIYFSYDMSSEFLSFDTRPVQMTSQPARRTRKGNRKSNPNSVEPLSVEEFKLPELKQLYLKPLPISAAKKRDLVNLCQKEIIPEEYQGWFKSLACEENIVDRVPDVAAAETSSSDDDEEAA